jgi:hypothetical protein
VAINQLTRYMSAPHQAHLNAAKHVLRYLRGTTGLGLCYSRTAHGSSGSSDCTLTGYCDATHGNVPVSGKSVSGYVFLFNGAAISWRSKVQSIVALSSAEAEFNSLSGATREVMYLRQLLCDLGFDQDKPTLMHEDNQPCIAMARSPMTTERNKHATVRFNFVREQMAAGTIILQYWNTANMLADALTKILPEPAHKRLRAIYLGITA